jgi:hypothetical protein
MSSNIKIFKLNYSGSFEEIPRDNLIIQFSLFDVISFYNPTLKRMYIWIGKKASPSLKSHIPRVREIFSEQYPDIKILRNITVESGSESSEFIDFIGISEKELEKRIKNLEILLLPSIAEINRLKESADKNFFLENYEDAIEMGRKILKLAEEINDESLKIDQQNFIKEAQARIKAHKKFEEIKDDSIKAIDQFQNLVDKEKIKEAHELVNQLKGKYDNDINLYSIPIFQELIMKDENLIYNLRSAQKKIYNKLDDLEIQYNRYLHENYLEKASRTIKSAKSLVNQLIEEKVSNKWKFLESKLKEAKEAFIKRIEKLSKNALSYLDKRMISDSLAKIEKIIIELEKITEV